MATADLSGRTVLITGGRRGIGAALAERLAHHGANIVLAAAGDAQGGLTATLARLRGVGVRAECVLADLSQACARADLVARAEVALGPIDILVNNAAANTYAAPSAMRLADRHMVFEVCLHAPVDLMQQALPGMAARRFGRILNIGSASMAQPSIPYPGPAHFVHGVGLYGAAKAALARFTEGLAAELDCSGVTVNQVHPTAVCVTGANSAAAIAALQRQPEMAEGVEMMAEAAYVLIAGSQTGYVGSSRDVLRRHQQPLHALDGVTIIGTSRSVPDLAALLAISA